MQNLSVVRGTSFYFTVKLVDSSGNRYFLPEGDFLIFGIKQRLDHKNYITTKRDTSVDYNEEYGGYTFEITPEDTNPLPFGKYYYDVGIQTADGEFFNVIECSTFTVKPAVTRKE